MYYVTPTEDNIYQTEKDSCTIFSNVYQGGRRDHRGRCQPKPRIDGAAGARPRGASRLIRQGGLNSERSADRPPDKGISRSTTALRRGAHRRSGFGCRPAPPSTTVRSACRIRWPTSRGRAGSPGRCRRCRCSSRRGLRQRSVVDTLVRQRQDVPPDLGPAAIGAGRSGPTGAYLAFISAVIPRHGGVRAALARCCSTRVGGRDAVNGSLAT